MDPPLPTLLPTILQVLERGLKQLVWKDENAAKNDFIGNSDAVTKRMSFMEFGIDSFDAQKLALNLPLRTEHDATHGTVAVRVRGSGPSGVSDNSSTVKV